MRETGPGGGGDYQPRRVLEPGLSEQSGSESYWPKRTFESGPPVVFEVDDKRRMLPFGVTLDGAGGTISLGDLKEFCQDKCGPRRDRGVGATEYQCAREVLLAGKTVERAAGELACIGCALSLMTGGPMLVHYVERRPLGYHLLLTSDTLDNYEAYFNETK